jgi:DNA-binding PucR family transcriptional regulator
MAGGELVLTSLTWYHRPEDAWTFVRSLTQAGAAGLVAGLAAVDAMPPALVAACTELGIALLTVPTSMSFNVLTESVARELLREQQQMAESLAVLGPEDVDAAEVVGRLVVRTGLSCTHLSAGGLTRTVAGEPLTEAERGLAWRAGVDGRGLPAAVRGDRPLTVVPLLAGSTGDIVGYLVLTGERRNWHPRVQVLIETAAERLSTPDQAALAVLDRRAEQLWSSSDDPGSPGTRDGTFVVVRASLVSPTAPVSLVRRIVAEMPDGPWGTVVDTTGTVTAFVHTTDDAAWTARARAQLSWYSYGIDPPEHLRVGISDPAPRSGLARALAAATTAHTWAAGGPAPVTVIAERDVGSHDLLLRLLPASLVHAHAERILEPVTRYDREHHSSLMTTLTEFLARSGSWNATAHALHVHVNTVRYRIRQVEKLTGRPLQREADRVDTRLAVECRRMVSALRNDPLDGSTVDPRR